MELTVGQVGHGGFCVARHEGRVVFVRHALPGERVLAVVTEDRGGSYCRADAVAVLEPAAGRVPPPCPASGPGGCGGCDFQHVDPQVQRELKAQVVAEQLRRIVGLDLAVTVQELPGGPLGWRRRTRLALDATGQAGFRVHRSHTVLPVSVCPLAVPGSLDPVLSRRWRPGAELEVVADDSAQLHVTQLRPGRPPAQLCGTGSAVWHAAGRRWELSALGFWQVHPAAADALAVLVGDWAAAPRGGTAWDLYGGVGLFASVLAGQVGPAGSVTVVEASRRAVADGAAALADLGQVRFVTGRVERALDQLPGRPDVVVLDPPRRGVGREVAAAVADRGPARIVHLACDPAALARDIAAYLTCGYRLLAVRALDAFPMTHHVECVAVLARPAKHDLHVPTRPVQQLLPFDPFRDKSRPPPPASAWATCTESEKIQNGGETVEVQWSELQRDPKGVAALTDRGDVRVRRRDGAALLLTREDRASSTAEGAVTAARALRNLFAHVEPQIAAAALVDECRWADVLPEHDRAQFVADFVRAFQASAEMEQWTPLAHTVREWKTTAAVHADPELVEQLSSPVNDDVGAVPDLTGD